jgi:hypothetical protein
LIGRYFEPWIIHHNFTSFVLWENCFVSYTDNTLQTFAYVKFSKLHLLNVIFWHRQSVSSFNRYYKIWIFKSILGTFLDLQFIVVRCSLANRRYDSLSTSIM